MTEDGNRPRLRLSRGRAVLGVLVGGTLLLIAAVLPWASAPAMMSRDAVAVAEVTGTQGVPVVPSAALVVLAAGLAIGLAGRIARVVAALAVALCGGFAAVSTIVFLREPEAALRVAAGEVSAVAELDGAAQFTPWPILALVIAIALALLGVLLPFLMGAWVRVGQRYERDPRPAPGGTRQHVSDWDALSRGEDPSEAEDR